MFQCRGHVVSFSGCAPYIGSSASDVIREIEIGACCRIGYPEVERAPLIADLSKEKTRQTLSQDMVCP